MGSILLDLEFTVELLAAEALFLIGAKHRKHFTLRVLISCIILAAMSLLLSYNTIFQLHGITHQVALIIRFLTLFGLTIIMISRCFECKRFHILFCATGGYLLQHIGFSLIELLKHGWMAAFPQIETPDALQTLIGWGLYAFIYFIIYKFHLCHMAKNDLAPNLWILLSMAASTLAVAVVLSIFAYSFDTQAEIVCRTLSLFACLMGLFSLTELRKNLHLQNEMELLNQKMALRAEQYMLLKDSIEATNILCHDFKHKIAQLREQHSLSGTETIDELEESIRRYDAIARTGNEVLDTILTEKSMVCNKAGIRFTYMVDQDALQIFNDTDMFALFGNALDNAIEATSKLPNDEQRVISVFAARRGRFLNIHFYNFFSHELELVDGVPVTTKQDKRYHGYGIKSIQAILQRYDGDMDISANGNIFDLNIVVPIAKL